MRNIVLFFLLHIGGVALGQVGINNLRPEADLDVDGSVKFRKLNNMLNFNQIIVANEEGRLAATEVEEGAFLLRDIYFKKMSQLVKTTSPSAVFVPNRSTLIELGLDIDIPISPHSEVIVSVEYNVPVINQYSNSNEYSNYLGITLIRKFNQTLVELDEGSRKITVYRGYTLQDRVRIVGVPITGKATDMVSNNTNVVNNYTYSAKGYIETGRGTIYYGDINSLFPRELNWGNGILVITVYEKAI